jgi:hypothetical protein
VREKVKIMDEPMPASNRQFRFVVEYRSLAYRPGTSVCRHLSASFILQARFAAKPKYPLPPDYSHEGVAVHRFEVAPVHDVAELYGEGDALTADG